MEMDNTSSDSPLYSSVGQNTPFFFPKELNGELYSPPFPFSSPSSPTRESIYSPSEYDIDEADRLDKKKGTFARDIVAILAANNPLNSVPLVAPYHDIYSVANTLTEADYDDDFTWSPDISTAFLARLLYEGFVPLGHKVRTKGTKWKYILLPKLHVQRCVLHPKDVHVSRKCRKKCKNFDVTIDTQFTEVLDICAKRFSNGWLFPPLVKGFTELFRGNDLVKMHSVELWKGGDLVAGEIGVSVGSWYNSLSGFHLLDSSGTIQMCVLGRILESLGFEIWDLGMSMEYKINLGAHDVPRAEFLSKVRVARDKNVSPLAVPGGPDAINCYNLIHKKNISQNE